MEEEFAEGAIYALLLLAPIKLKGGDKAEAYFKRMHRWALLLDLRYNQSKTLCEIGIILGVTRERVRQIEAKALRQLRHPRGSFRHFANSHHPLVLAVYGRKE